MDSASALAELKSFQGSRKGAGDYYDQYQKDLGVGDVKTRADDMRGLIRNTETALKGVGQAVAGRTRGQLVTEAQRARLANIEREPLSGQLSEQQNNYGEEMTNYRDLLGQAQTRSGMAYQTDADRLGALESNYSKLFAGEQAAEAKRQWEVSQAEAKRQFEAQLAESRRSAANQAAAIRAATPTLTPTKTAPANMIQRKGGGFNITDANGQAISAAKYAQLTGQNIASVFQAMGQAGDKYAAQVFNQLRADPWVDKNMDKYKKSYSALFWGT